MDIRKSSPYWLLFIVISISLFNSFLIDKHFSADGIHYFCQILEKKTFVHHDWSRQHALYITQWPVVLALQLGVKDIAVLNMLFATGIYSVYLLSFLLCNHALRGKDKTLLIWPLLSIVSLNLTTDYHLSGEFPVVMLMAWPILFFLLRTKMSRTDKVILFLLMIFYSRIYQSAMGISFIFFLLLLYQFFILRQKRNTYELYPLLILTLFIFFVSFESTIKPFSESNRFGFLSKMPLILFNKPLVASFAFLILISPGIIFRKKWLYFIALLPIFYLFYILFTEKHGPSAIISFASRSVSVTVLPMLLLMSLFFYYKNLRLTRLPILIMSLFILVMVAVNIQFSNDWRNFKKEYSLALESHSGIVSIKQTNLWRNPCKWEWTNPFLSIAWSNGCVRTIIINDEKLSKFPYDPHTRILWTEYLHYSPEFLKIDSSVSICN